MTTTSLLARCLVALPLAALSGVVCLAMVWSAGWGFETSPLARVRESAEALALAGVSGAVCGGLLAYAFRDGRRWIAAGALLGVMPAVLVLSALVTDLY